MRDKCVNDICPKQTATCMPTKCKQPKQAIHADRNQEIQRPQTNANNTFSRQRFCVWRQTCFIMAPKTGSKKLVETWRPGRGTQAAWSLRFMCSLFMLSFHGLVVWVFWFVLVCVFAGSAVFVWLVLFLFVLVFASFFMWNDIIRLDTTSL